MTEAIFGIQPEQFESVVRKLKSARDSYAKLNVFDECGVNWGDRQKALWALIEAGHYDAWNDPAIWHELGQFVEHATTETLVDFLAHVEHYDAQASASDDSGAEGEDFYDDEEAYYDDEYYDDGGYGGYVEPPFESPRLVSFWPSTLDVLAMHAYARDADLVESRAVDFSPEVQKGLQLVRLRFGKIGRDELPEDTVESLAQIYVWKSFPWYVWDVVDGKLTQLEIGRSDGEGPQQKQFFLSHFADEQNWAQTVLKAIFDEDYGPSFERTVEAWPVASLEQLELMIERISFYNAQRVTAFEQVLCRDDSPDQLLGIAHSLKEKNRDAQAEFAALCAVLKAADRGLDAPEDALEFINFRNLDNPYTRAEYYSLPFYIRALQCFDEEKAVARFIEVFDGEYTKVEPFPALKAFSDNSALLQKAFQAAEDYAAKENTNFYGMNKVALGLGLLSTDHLAQIAEAHDRSATALARDTYRRAIMGILADAETAQDEAYDRFISLVDLEAVGTAENELGFRVAEDYRKALQKLPQERAVARVSSDIDESRAHWPRVFAALSVLPDEKLLDKTFGILAREGLPPMSSFDWFRPFLQNQHEKALPFLGLALASSKSVDFHNAVKGALGQQEYDRVLSESGAESAADKSPVDKVRRLSKEYFTKNPDAERTFLYAFTRQDDAPEANTLNRIGGRPFGISEWPCADGDEDSPMQHIFTLDLESVPRIKARYKDGLRAVSLFVHQPDYNEAYSPGNGCVELAFVSADDVAEYEDELPTGDDEAFGFLVEEVEVPLEAWSVRYDGDEALNAIKNAIYSLHAWGGGGGPIWLQDDEHWGDFLLQFDEGFAYMNLGDCGIMYVFSDTAFWQCH